MILLLVQGLLTIVRCIEVGNFVTIDGVVDKVFVSEDGSLLDILKGGVVREILHNDVCHVLSLEENETAGDRVSYVTRCSNLRDSHLSCPSTPMSSTECEFGDINCMAHSVFNNGFAKLKAAVPGFPGGKLAKKFASNKLRRLLHMAKQVGVDAESLDFHFSDVSSRGPGRWEMAVQPEDLVAEGDADSRHWLQRMWAETEEQIILPVLLRVTELEQQLLQGGLGAATTLQVGFTSVFDGVLTSLCGADTQHWHRDSGVHTQLPSHYSVYIAASDVLASQGPTEFLPGTNRDFGFRFEDWTSRFDYCVSLQAPLLRAGEMLIWEYRVVHRGTRNVHCQQHESGSEGGVSEKHESAGGAASRDGKGEHTDIDSSSLRAMLYRTYHLQGSWRDINMGNTSFYTLARDRLGSTIQP